MEERFDGSRWSLRWERKGSTRGTEERAKDDGGCEILRLASCCSDTNALTSGCSVGLDLMLLSSTRPAAENGGVGVGVVGVTGISRWLVSSLLA